MVTLIKNGRVLDPETKLDAVMDVLVVDNYITKIEENIADEAVPLADVAVESEQAKMSWWWWLIILILGATGYEMYKKHNEKKLKAQAENAGDIEE